MAFNAVLGTQSYNETGVVDNSHPPIVTAMEPLADQGELAPGLIASKNADGKVIPFDHFTESIGTGDNSGTDFSGTLASPPVRPGSVEVTDGIETFSDDECGNLTGDAGGSGTVNYVTGEISVSFDSAPATDADISVAYTNRVAGVLTLRVDTANEDVAPVLEHGTVAQHRLTRNGSDPSTADLASLRAAGIYPR